METPLPQKLLELANNAGFENGFEVEGYDLSTAIKVLVDYVKLDVIWEVVKDPNIPHEIQLQLTNGINKLYSGD